VSQLPLVVHCCCCCCWWACERGVHCCCCCCCCLCTGERVAVAAGGALVSVARHCCCWWTCERGASLLQAHDRYVHAASRSGDLSCAVTMLWCCGNRLHEPWWCFLFDTPRWPIRPTDWTNSCPIGYLDRTPAVAVGLDRGSGSPDWIAG
jgi:hypothetical protein